MTDLQAHPLAGAFPFLTTARAAELAADVKKNGLRDAITLYEGMILDGRNRYRACTESGTDARFETFTGTEVEAGEFVKSKNLQRRDLDTGQRVAAVLLLDEMIAAYREAARATQGTRTDLSPRVDGSPAEKKKMNDVLTQIGKATDASRGLVGQVDRAKRESPELFERIRDGRITPRSANEVLKIEDEALRAETIALLDANPDMDGKAARQKVQQKHSMQAEIDAALAAHGPLPEGALTLYVAPCRSLIGAVDAKSVDVIITDPPYPHEFIECYDELAEFAAHALKPGALLYTMAGHTFLPEVIDKLSNYGLLYHWTCAIRLTGRHGNVIGRCTNIAWKPLLVFTAPGGSKKQIGFDLFESAGSESEVLHEWGQSLDVCQKIIERCSEPDDLVCDPFLGSGTFAVAALTAGRRFIGADIEQRWIDTTYERLGLPTAA